MKNATKSWLSRLWIIVVAALLVEIISLVQYKRIRGVMEEETEVRAYIVLGAIAAEIGHMMELTEATMSENLWEVRRNLGQPDSLFPAMKRLIDDNPHVVGGCISFVPGHSPSRERLFEPYAYKWGGKIKTMQLAGPDHDYTQNPSFRAVAETGVPSWSDPYLYGRDSLFNLTTFSYPVLDGNGEIAAVCGLDIDISWLGDTLVARQHFPSSFGLLLTRDGKLVVAPPADRTAPEKVEQVMQLISEGKMLSADGKTVIHRVRMNRDPYWQVVEVYDTEEVYEGMHNVWRKQIGFILLGLAILFFMIERFAHNEKELRKATEKQARIDGELAVARNIQQEMLPKTFPAGISGHLEPALEVGGDLYDFYRRDGKLFFCIGDVSGKGVPAAMLMSVLHSLFRLISGKEESPSKILKALNRQLCESNESNMFVTFFVGCLDLYTGKLRYSNAGHDKPFLLPGSGASLLPAKANMPLGVFTDTEFKEQSLTIEPGSGIFLYTDGLTEAKNARRQAFGREHVQEILNSCIKEGCTSAESTVAAVSEAAHAFEAGAPQADDLTILLIKYEPGELLRVSITLINDKDEAEKLGPFLKDFLSKLELDRKTAGGLRLALEEAVVNVIYYAYPEGETGDVTVYAESDRSEVRFTVVDSGMPFDPTAVLSADTTLDAQNRPIGGLGIHLVRKLTDSVSYSRKDGKNVLILTKSII
ncbi:MAG: SpoIIE family protein phosphatase [Bacteroidales bacterium]|nr:SpoIIE family protein phosphatase [Bacteroidales bacterium]